MVKNYDDVKQTIKGLWPRYQPTPEEAKLFRERLASCRTEWLVEAIESHRAEDKTGKHKPDLARIRERYRAISESGERIGGSPQSPKVIGWRAVWTQPIEGQPYRMTSRDLLADRDAAMMYASSRGQRPDAFPVGDEPVDARSQYERGEVEQDDRDAEQRLMATPNAKIEASARWLIGARVLDKMPIGEPRSWSRFTRGVVDAAVSEGRAK